MLTREELMSLDSAELMELVQGHKANEATHINAQTKEVQVQYLLDGDVD